MMTPNPLEASISSIGFWIQISAILAAIGIVCGTWLGWRHWQLSKELQAQQKAEIAQLSQQAAAANLRAEELEAQIQPRYLTQEQQESIAAEMQRFAGGSVLVTSHWVDAEAARLARQLKSVLNSAGIGVDSARLSTTTVDRIGQYPEIVTGTFAGGVVPGRPILQTGVGIWGNNPAAVESLASALSTIGKLTGVGRIEPPSGFDIYGDQLSLAIFVGGETDPRNREGLCC